MISACATAPNHQHWPKDIPPKKLFTDHYQQDIPHQNVLSEQEYLTWVHRFYYGWELYKRGWMLATQELEDSLENPQEKQKARNTMRQIGELIAPEWAKNKRHRIINTRHLNIWGNTINESIVQKEQLKILSKILTDVKALRQKQIMPDSILTNRYYPEKPFASNLEF
jgi:hypothetical protein